MTERRKRPVGKRLQRGAYLLPSLFTTGNIFLGFYALILGLRGNFQLAALLIFIAAFLDGLDGRIARLTGTDSAFGQEYDSLADVLTFGLSPALLSYLWGLEPLGRAGALLPLFFVVCAATRLARFNVLASTPADRRFFVGLPAPAAAGAIGSILFFAHDSGESRTLAVLLLVALALVGMLMVSSFRYYSFKELDLRQRRNFRIGVPIAVFVLVAMLRPAAFFLAVSSSYALSGPVLWLRGRLRPREPESPSLVEQPERTP